MEHFLLPNGVEPEPIDIPYVCNDEYDGGDFLTYPERQNWTEDDLKGRNSFGGRSPNDVEAFFQTWLYFGFLHSVLTPSGVTVKTSDFIRQSGDGGKYITTKMLPDLLLSWINKEGVTDVNLYKLAPKFDESAQKDPSRTARGKAVDAIICKLSKQLGSYGYLEEDQHDHESRKEPKIQPMSPETVLSIKAIGDAISSLASSTYGGEVGLNIPQWGSSPILRARLRKAGWCPKDIPVFGTTRRGVGKVDTDYYFLHLKLPRDVDHSTCTQSTCRGTLVDVSKYKTKHYSDWCDGSCDFITAPSNTLDIIKDGGIPIMTWYDGELTCKKYDSESRTRYVAISHVWADGMGNETHNSLPHCQLERIQRFVNKLYTQRHISTARRERLSQPAAPHQKVSLDEMIKWVGSDGKVELDEGLEWWDGERWETALAPIKISRDTVVGFWMDTLCVPVQPDLAHYRKEVIRQMRDIYTSAHRVLVLDSWIQQVSVEEDVLTKVVQIYTGNWRRRLWTLQEGLFARSLFFQFKDRALTGPEMEPELALYNLDCIKKNYSSILFNCTGETYEPLDLFAVTAFKRLDVLQLFKLLSLDVSKRTTSKMTDEAICFATAMLKDPKHVLEGPEGARMERFYELVQVFDARIVFNRFPRLTVDGFRWAPSSFLGEYRDPCPGPNTTCLATVNVAGGGLMLEYPGLKLDSFWTGAHLGDRFYFITESDTWFMVSIHQDDGANFPGWNPDVQYFIISSQVVRRRHPAIEQAILGSFEDNLEGGRIRLRHLATVTINLVTERLKRIKAAAEPYFSEKRKFTGDESSFKGIFPVRGDDLPKGQKWCIV